MSQTFILIFIISLVFIGYIIIWQVPKLQTKEIDGDRKDKFQLENEARKTLIQMSGGIFFLGTLFFSWNSYQVSKNSQLSQQLTNAISLFSSESKYQKSAAIYSLKQLASQMPHERETIFQLLLSYVRDESYSKRNNIEVPKWLSPDFYKCDQQASIRGYETRIDSMPLLATDIQIAVTTLISLHNQYKLREWLDLSNLNMAGLKIQKLNISNIDFRNSNLNYITMDDVTCDRESLFGEASMKYAEIGGRFFNTNFYRANLKNAFFSTGEYIECQFGESNLYSVNFEDVVLEKSGFWGANMTEAFFEVGIQAKGNGFQGTILHCADLREMSTQIESFTESIINSKTIMPDKQ